MAPEIRRAETDDDFASLAVLFREYAEELGVDLCFQGFEDELANLRTYYAAAWLAGAPSALEGCVGLKRLSDERCEMKRLYVRSDARAGGLGRTLANKAMQEAIARGYREMVLDTLERLAPAIRLYEDMGFDRCAPYYKNPEPDVVYMAKGL